MMRSLPTSSVDGSDALVSDGEMKSNRRSFDSSSAAADSSLRMTEWEMNQCYLTPHPQLPTGQGAPGRVYTGRV